MGRDILISSAVFMGKNKTKCDDNVFYKQNKLGYFIGLSDGAGSKQYSHIGSLLSLQFTENFILKFLQTNHCNPLKINIELKKELLKKIQKSIIDFYLKKNITIDINDYAATLLFAQYIKKYDRWFIGHIGDGVIGGIDKNNDLKIISTPENGEFSNETFFFSDKYAFKHLRFYWIKGLKGIVMFSDGPEVVLYDKKNIRLAPGVKNLFNWQLELKENFDEVLWENLKEFAKYTHDDCSIILFQKKDVKNVKYRVFKK